MLANITVSPHAACSGVWQGEAGRADMDIFNNHTDDDERIEFREHGWFYADNGDGSYSRSEGAEIAEMLGKMPMTRAKKTVARVAKVSQKKAEEALESVYEGEWHYTGNQMRRTKYYRTVAAIEVLKEKENI